MLIKILIIAVIIGLIWFWIFPPKHRAPKVRAVPPPRGRLVLSLLSSAAVLLFILAFFCLLLWLGGVAGVVTGGGEVIAGTGLLRIAGVLLLLAIICAVAAWYKRPR